MQDHQQGWSDDYLLPSTFFFSCRTKDSTSTHSRINSETKEQLVRFFTFRTLVNALFVPQALYTKLFFVLGILWGSEGIHAIIHKKEDCQNSPWDVFFRAIDSLNILRGFFIFLIFICKRTVWTKITRYYKQKSGQSARGRLNKQNQVNICCVSLLLSILLCPGHHELHDPVQHDQQADQPWQRHLNHQDLLSTVLRWGRSRWDQGSSGGEADSI